jgi:hypothetical protein
MSLLSLFRSFVPAIAGIVLLAAPCSKADTLVESFSSDPGQKGWRWFGETNLFQWDSTNENLSCIWNSSLPNSYFYHPLGNILARDDDFSMQFDIRLDDIGPADSFEFSFQMGIGFLNIDQATQPSFLRGTGVNATNVAELAYFRADNFGDPATVYPTLIDKDGGFNYNPGGTDSTNYVLNLGNWYRLNVSYYSSSNTMVMQLTNLSTPGSARVVQPIGNTFSSLPFTDLRVNAFSVNSYNEAGQYPGFEGSILAHGAVDNFIIVLPPPPVRDISGAFSNADWQVQFVSRTNWLYTLERTTKLEAWASVVEKVPGNGTNLVLTDTNAPAAEVFYRVRAERP